MPLESAIESTNAPRKSTGPTTQAGKDRSRLNALRHGLAGKTVVMPWEDRVAYKAHCAAYCEHLAPVGEIEVQLVEGIADDSWRLIRARAVDANMFALGNYDYLPRTGNSRIDEALNTAREFRDNSKAFVNLTLYEQRIIRSIEKSLAHLQALQTTRRTSEAPTNQGTPAILSPVFLPGQQEFVYATSSPGAEQNKTSGIIPGELQPQ